MTGLASRALAPRTVRGHVDEGDLAVIRHAPPLTVCSLDAPGRGHLTATGTTECAGAVGVAVRGRDGCAHDRLAVARPGMTACGHTGPTTGHVTVAGLVTALPFSSDRSRSGKRSWRPEWSRRDREEAVVASRDHSNSESPVEPAPVVAGGSIPLPTSSFQDLIRLFLSLSGPVAQRDAAIGSMLSAADVTGAGVLPSPATLVTSAAPVACSSAMPAPGVSTPTGAASTTTSPGWCEHTWESCCIERRRRRSSGRERSRSGGKCGKGQSPSHARSARSASVSASSSSESLDTEGRVSAMPPPPSGRSGVGGSRFKSDRSAPGCDCSPQPGPSGLGSGEQSALCADRSHSEYRGRSSPSPSGAADDDQGSVSGSVDLDQDDSFRNVLCLIREFPSMEELASVAPNQCMTSLAPIYGLQSV